MSQSPHFAALILFALLVDVARAHSGSPPEPPRSGTCVINCAAKEPAHRISSTLSFSGP